MCDKIAEAIDRVVKATIKEKMRSGDAFTSVDVANEIKRRGSWIRNRTVAQICRENVINFSNEMGMTYEATLVTVDTGSSMTQAYLYHDRDFDPTDYDSRDQKAISRDEFEDMHKIDKGGPVHAPGRDFGSISGLPMD